jgi:hypothetical protein
MMQVENKIEVSILHKNPFKIKSSSAFPMG